MNHNFKKRESKIIVFDRWMMFLLLSSVKWKWCKSFSTVCRILPHIGVNITENKIESCHCQAKNNDRSIVKFSSRKDCEHTKSVKKELKGLSNEIKKLRNKNIFLTVTGTARKMLQEKDPFNIITYLDDLKEPLLQRFYNVWIKLYRFVRVHIFRYTSSKIAFIFELLLVSKIGMNLVNALCFLTLPFCHYLC